MIEEKIVKDINKMLKAERLSKGVIYERLLSKGLIEPNSKKFFSNLLNKLIENNQIPAHRIQSISNKKGKLPEIFTREQIQTLFENCVEPKLALCMWLGFFCGLRIREVCSLKVSDIDLSTNTIFIRNSKNTRRTAQGGYGTDRKVKIPDIAVEPIKKWIDLLQGGEWLICSLTNPNKPTHRTVIQGYFRDLLKECNLNQAESVTTYDRKRNGKKRELKMTEYKYSFHTLRHTYATYLRDQGAKLETIQALLGHKDLNTTLVYAKLSTKKLSKEVNTAFTMKEEKLKPIKMDIRGEDPLNLLKKQYLNNLITEEEYYKKKRVIEG